MLRGTYVAKSVKSPSLGFSSGWDPRDPRWSPASGSSLITVCWRFFLPLPLPLTLSLSLSLPLSKINLKKSF